MQSTDIIVIEQKRTILCLANSITNVIIRSSDTKLIINLIQENARCNIYGLQLASKTQEYNLNLLINHKAANCISNTLLRGVYTNNAIGNIRAKIYIDKRADNTNANLENKNLLLSRYAMITTMPQLEIYNDSVKCSHGATVSTIDLEALFYLHSRGIAYDIAKQMLIKSFISPVLFNNKCKQDAQKRLSDF